MSITQWLARKGAVGGTARWTAKYHQHAVDNQLYNVENFSSQDGINQEINNVIDNALLARSKVSKADSIAKIRAIYNGAPMKGLVALTVAILKVEASFSDNDQNVVKEFLIVIDEELDKKKVGNIIKFGTNEAITEAHFLPLLFLASHKH